MLKPNLMKTMALGLSFFIFITNSVLVHATEIQYAGQKTGFWKQRHVQVALAADSQNRNQKLKEIILALPPTFGFIQNISLHPSDQIVIHIQDIHTHLGAQNNIASLVQMLIQQQRVDLVALEGTFGEVSLEGIRNIADKEAAGRVADYLLREHRISGPVYAAITSPHKIPPFVGIDDMPLYQAHVDAVKQAHALRPEAKQKNKKDTATLPRTRFIRQKLIDFTLTRKEWDEYKSRGGAQLRQSPFESFYEIAEARDEKMAANLMRAIKENNSQVTLLVTGGFHSQGIQAKLHSQNITTLSWLPKLGPMGKEKKFSPFQNFIHEETPLDQLFAGKNIFLAPRPTIFEFLFKVLSSLASMRLTQAVQRFGKMTIIMDSNGGDGPIERVRVISGPNSPDQDLSSLSANISRLFKIDDISNPALDVERNEKRIAVLDEVADVFITYMSLLFQTHGLYSLEDDARFRDSSIYKKIVDRSGPLSEDELLEWWQTSQREVLGDDVAHLFNLLPESLRGSRETPQGKELYHWLGMFLANVRLVTMRRNKDGVIKALRPYSALDMRRILMKDRLVSDVTQSDDPQAQAHINKQSETSELTEAIEEAGFKVDGLDTIFDHTLKISEGSPNHKLSQEDVHRTIEKLVQVARMISGRPDLGPLDLLRASLIKRFCRHYHSYVRPDLPFKNKPLEKLWVADILMQNENTEVSQKSHFDLLVEKLNSLEKPAVEDAFEDVRTFLIKFREDEDVENQQYRKRLLADYEKVGLLAIVPFLTQFYAQQEVYETLLEEAPKNKNLMFGVRAKVTQVWYKHIGEPQLEMLEGEEGHFDFLVLKKEFAHNSEDEMPVWETVISNPYLQKEFQEMHLKAIDGMGISENDLGFGSIHTPRSLKRNMKHKFLTAVENFEDLYVRRQQASYIARDANSDFQSLVSSHLTEHHISFDGDPYKDIDPITEQIWSRPLIQIPHFNDDSAPLIEYIKTLRQFRRQRALYLRSQPRVIGHPDHAKNIANYDMSDDHQRAWPPKSIGPILDVVVRVQDETKPHAKKWLLSQGPDYEHAMLSQMGMEREAYYRILGEGTNVIGVDPELDHNVSEVIRFVFGDGYIERESTAGDDDREQIEKYPIVVDHQGHFGIGKSVRSRDRGDANFFFREALAIELADGGRGNYLGVVQPAARDARELHQFYKAWKDSVMDERIKIPRHHTENHPYISKLSLHTEDRFNQEPEANRPQLELDNRTIRSWQLVFDTAFRNVDAKATNVIGIDVVNEEGQLITIRVKIDPDFYLSQDHKDRFVFEGTYLQQAWRYWALDPGAFDLESYDLAAFRDAIDFLQTRVGTQLDEILARARVPQSDEYKNAKWGDQLLTRDQIKPFVQQVTASLEEDALHMLRLMVNNPNLNWEEGEIVETPPNIPQPSLMFLIGFMDLGIQESLGFFLASFILLSTFAISKLIPQISPVKEPRPAPSAPKFQSFRRFATQA